MREFWSSCWNAGANLVKSTNFAWFKCEPDWYWDVSEFKDFDLWLVLNGVGTVQIEGRTHPLSAGFWTCFHPGKYTVHAQHNPQQPLQVFYCHFDVTGVETGEFDHAQLPLNPSRVEPDALLWSTVQSLARQRPGRQDESLQEALLWQLLLHLEALARTPVSSPDERVEQAAMRIRESPGGHYQVEELARSASLSSGHFRRLFHQVAGESPIQFVISHRVKRACYFLEETRLSIQQIARNLGYADIYFFSRQFKERTGLSPRAWRERHRA